jgi:methyl-accepting chemotaxis protein
MTSIRQIRGSGVSFTLPYVLRFSGLWLAVSVLTLAVFSVASYLLLLDRADGAGRDGLVVVLALQTLGVLVALIALAVFTTHRLAGPLVEIRRALEEVEAGHLDRELRFRREDEHLRAIETSFNGMLASLRQRVPGDGALP